MKRYIYNIQYNSTDPESLYDLIYLDAANPTNAKQKLRKQFPGIYKAHFVRVEKELP